MKIITNNVRRQLRCLDELPEKWQREFDYVTDKNYPRFVLYGNDWYDACDTQAIKVSGEYPSPMGWAMYVEPTNILAKWHAIRGDSFFSGMLYRFSEENGYDLVVVGRYYS
jgi:hypothetical protein